MVLPLLSVVGMGTSLLGGLFGGRARKKAAQRAQTQAAALAAKQATDLAALQAAQDAENAKRRASDIEDAKAHFATEQAEIDARQGLDLGKLVSDAEAAGFNPLTVLQTTGGGAYDRAATFLQSPFIGRTTADYSMQGQGVVQSTADRVQAARDVAGTAGYFGDSLTTFGQTLVGVSQEHARLQQDARIAAQIAGRQGPRVTVSDARPKGYAGPARTAGAGGKAPDFFTLGKEVEELPPVSAPILTRGETMFGDVYYPGSGGEPWGVDELITVGIATPINLALRGMAAVRGRMDAWNDRVLPPAKDYWGGNGIPSGFPGTPVPNANGKVNYGYGPVTPFAWPGSNP